jgi:hypothetical protein
MGVSVGVGRIVSRAGDRRLIVRAPGRPIVSPRVTCEQGGKRATWEVGLRIARRGVPAEEPVTMPKTTDIRPVATTLYYLPIKTRIPLKFGPEITTEVTCVRVRLEVADALGRTAVGWGETPLGVHWA